jgi:hypothetical protein
MANHYLQFSEVLDELRPEEEAWLREQLELLHVHDGREYAEGNVPEELIDHKPDWSGYRFLRDVEGPGDNRFLGFEYKFCDQENAMEGYGRDFWVYADDSGEPERVVHLIQKFLRKFRPDDYWSLSYASYCDKPRVGEFDGGAVFVTAENVKWCSGNDFLHEEVKAFKQRRACDGERLKKLRELANRYYRTDDIEIDPLQGEHELSVVEGEGIWVRSWVFLSNAVLEEHGLTS